MAFLIMADHDTTSKLTSMVYTLARNEQWQDRQTENSLTGIVGCTDRTQTAGPAATAPHQLGPIGILGHCHIE
jgi:cytochrome P450